MAKEENVGFGWAAGRKHEVGIGPVRPPFATRCGADLGHLCPATINDRLQPRREQAIPLFPFRAF